MNQYSSAREWNRLDTRWFLLMPVFLFFSATGCEREPPVEHVEVDYGTYLLERINGQPLPVITDQNGEFAQEVLSGALTLERDPSRTADNPGGDFEFRYTVRNLVKGHPPAAPHEFKSTGLFFTTTDRLLLNMHSGTGRAEAMLGPGQITTTLQEKVYVFRK